MIAAVAMRIALRPCSRRRLVCRAASVSVASVIRTANRYEGIRYSYGGASPTKGFDCSGFVQYVFSRHGVALPRTSRQIAELGEPVPLNRDDLREGDLLFFAGNGTRIDHVAIYLGDDHIIHSTASGGGVRIESLTSARGEWFDRRMVAARRLLGGRGLDRQLDELERAAGFLRSTGQGAAAGRARAEDHMPGTTLRSSLTALLVGVLLAPAALQAQYESVSAPRRPSRAFLGRPPGGRATVRRVR